MQDITTVIDDNKNIIQVAIVNESCVMVTIDEYATGLELTITFDGNEIYINEEDEFGWYDDPNM